jgi:hypothetical protein
MFKFKKKINKTSTSSLTHAWINKKVILISNDFESNPNHPSLQIATIIDFISSEFANIPIVSINNKTYTTFAITIEYSEELFNILNKLSPYERYTLAMSICHRFK